MRCSNLLFMTCMQSSITMEEWSGATTRPTLGCQATRIVSAAMLVSLHSRLRFPFMIWSQIGICSPCPLLVPLVGWRLFDDSTVTMVDESQVVTRYAYVLFYRRRNSPVERQAHFHRPGAAESPTAAGAAASQVRLTSVPTGNSWVVEGKPWLFCCDWSLYLNVDSSFYIILSLHFC